MDFCVNGIFKKNLWKRHANGIPGLKRAITKEWKKLDLTVIQNALRSWPSRVRLMSEKQGFQVEI